MLRVPPPLSPLHITGVRQVLSFLDQSKSTYCTPFAKLCKEVFTAREEANDNVLFLSPLEEHLADLLSTGRFYYFFK